MRIIDGHAHVVQVIAGFGAEGELRSQGLSDGTAVYASGSCVQMIPKEFHSDCVTPEHLLSVMDSYHVEKAVLLQGNFYGFQNLYTHQAVEKYPDRFTGAASYDPYSFRKEKIRHYLFEELKFRIEKFEMSTGSGLMAVHPQLELDGPVMEEAYSYAEAMGHVFVIDIGKCKSKSWNPEALSRAICRHPRMKFVVCHLLAPSLDSRQALEDGLRFLKLPNVWFDLASLPHNCQPEAFPWPTARSYVALAKNLVGAEKLIFGTDLPSPLKEHSYQQEIDFLLDWDGLCPREKEAVFYHNAREVYFSS